MASVRQSAQGPPGDIWKQHQSTIRQLYMVERKTLKEVKQIMETEHEFPRMHLSTYGTKLRDELGMEKKVKKGDWSAVYQHWKRREGRDTGVYLNGVQIEWRRAWKEIRRSEARTNGNNTLIPLPPGLVVRTPSPVPQLAPPTLPSTTQQHIETFPICTSSQYFGPLGTAFQSHHAREADLVQATFTIGDFFLENLPMNTLIDQLNALNINPVQVSFKLASNTVHMLGASTLPSPLLMTERTQYSQVPSLHFDTYHTLIRAMYLLSNDMLPHPMVSARPVIELFKILFHRIHQGSLLNLFKSNFPTVRAAWEVAVSFAAYINHKDAFRLLMSIGSQRPDWILSNGQRYLVLAINMDTNSTEAVHGLLKTGARPDDPMRKKYVGPIIDRIPGFAILEAVARDNIPCAEVLIKECDVNRIIYRSTFSAFGVSNFSRFIYELIDGCHWTYMGDKEAVENMSQRIHKTKFCLRNATQDQALDMFLHNGADVDAIAQWDLNDRMLPLYRATAIPRGCQLTLLEESFYRNQELYDRLAPYSIKSALEITRHGTLLSAAQGKEVLRGYLGSRVTRYAMGKEQLLELILAEQFFIDDSYIDALVVLRLIETGIDITLPTLKIEGKNGVDNAASCLLLMLVRKFRLHGVSDDDVALLQVLIQSGQVIDSKILHIGVPVEGVGILPLLLQYGADVKNQGAPALSAAARLNNYKAVSWLLDNGVDVNAEVYTHDGSSSIIALASGARRLPPEYLFDWASSRASCEMLEQLVQRGAEWKISSGDSNYFNFLHGLLLNRSPHDQELPAMINVVISSGASLRLILDPTICLLEACLVSSPRSSMPPPLSHHELSAMKLLFTHGALVKSKGALACLIVRGGPHDLIREFLDAGADIQAYCSKSPFSSFRCNPLQAAAARRDHGLVCQLLQRGANINQPARGDRGRTALQAACEWNASSTKEAELEKLLVRFLIEQGAEVNATAAPQGGVTALQAAAIRGDIETAVLLLAHGAQPNAPRARKKGRCALDGAAERGRLDMVQLLLNVGAHSHPVGYQKAIRYAKDEGHFAVAELIRQHADNYIKIYGSDIAWSMEQAESSPGSSSDEGDSDTEFSDSDEM